ncbi:acyltransferase family protein [Mucilaginibacter ximonensis]|uniref:Acyltransferase family protein n=1 Tax=Mucilaginibacter ximonensis TaxID=538021 RepID=A0ABW5YBA1_9SPHI
MEKPKIHYYWLDLFRGLAALVVVMMHCRALMFVEFGLLPPSNKTMFTKMFYLFTRLGHQAVMVFFVLSGFLVGGKLIQRLKEGTFDLRSYTIDRTVRIFLPLTSAIILIFISNTITGQKYGIIDYFGNLLSLQDILVTRVSGPLWSLAYEVWFYILMGAIAWCFITSKMTYKYASALILFICFLIFSYSLRSVYLFIWLLGAISFLFGKKNNVIKFSGIVLLILSVGAFELYGHDKTLNAYKENHVEIIELSIGLAVCILAQQVVFSQPKRKLSIAIDGLGTKLANFSYTLYLTHVPIAELLVYEGFPKNKSVNARSIFNYTGGIVIALIGAYVLYWLFEKRTKYVKNKINQLLDRKKHILEEALID